MLKCLTCASQRDQNSLAYFKLNKTPTSLKYLSSIKQKIGAGLFLSLVIYLLLHFLCPVVKESSIKNYSTTHHNMDLDQFRKYVSVYLGPCTSN
jgi:hypothetical protein